MANFTPTLTPIHEKSPFRFWCQKVLPTVYDDSLSYYELLTKVVYYLNENTQDLETVNSNVEALYNSFVELQNYVTNYLEGELPQIVRDKLDEMAEDGTLTELIRAIVDPYFAAKTAEIDETLDEQNDNIRLLISRMDAFLNAHTGLTNETILWTGNESVSNTEITLSDDYINYNYLEFHYEVNSSVCAKIFRVDAGELSVLVDGVNLSIVEPTASVQDNYPLQVLMLNVRRVQESDGSLIPIRVPKKLNLSAFEYWYWDGDASSDATKIIEDGVTGQPVIDRAGTLTKVVGISNEQVDAEIVDARVGYNGTTYNTLGDAIRTQVGDIVDRVDVLEGKTYPLVGEFELGAMYTDSQEAVVYLTYADIANAVVAGRPVFIKNNTNNLMLQYTETKNNTHYFTGQTVDPETNEIIVHTVTRPARNGIYFKTKITGTRVV